MHIIQSSYHYHGSGQENNPVSQGQTYMNLHEIVTPQPENTPSAKPRPRTSGATAGRASFGFLRRTCSVRSSHHNPLPTPGPIPGTIITRGRQHLRGGAMGWQDSHILPTDTGSGRPRRPCAAACRCECTRKPNAQPKHPSPPTAVPGNTARWPCLRGGMELVRSGEHDRHGGIGMPELQGCGGCGCAAARSRSACCLPRGDGPSDRCLSPGCRCRTRSGLGARPSSREFERHQNRRLFPCHGSAWAL